MGTLQNIDFSLQELDMLNKSMTVYLIHLNFFRHPIYLFPGPAGNSLALQRETLATISPVNVVVTFA